MKKISNSCFMFFFIMITFSCNQTKDGESKQSTQLKSTTVGFIFIGSKSDYGWNQAHAEGAEAIKKIPDTRVFQEENVPERINAEKTIESMIQVDGANLIFATSYGYFEPDVLAMARKYPDVFFLHSGGIIDSTKHPKNIGSYFAYIHEPMFLCGMVAAFSSKSKKLGFVAAKPIPQVLRNINAFALGARSVDSTITITLNFTGDWFLPIKEAEATNSLIDQGADVIASHLNSPKVMIETAEKRGVYTIGYHADQHLLAPKGYLTGAIWDWGKLYTDYIQKFKNGIDLSGMHRYGIKEGIVTLAPYGPIVSEAAKKKTEEVREQFMSESGFHIFKGPLVNNEGVIVLKEGQIINSRDPELENMNYLVKGVIGKLPSK